MSRRSFNRVHFAIAGVCFYIVFGGLTVALQGVWTYDSVIGKEGYELADEVWRNSQVAAVRNEGRFPAAEVMVRELAAASGATVMSEDALLTTELPDKQAALAVLTASSDQASFLIRVGDYAPLRVEGSVGQVEAERSKALSQHLNWDLFFILQLAAFLASLMAAFLLERSIRKERDSDERVELEKWQKLVPDLTYGPMDPLSDFTVLAADARDVPESNEVLFRTRELTWRGYYWAAGEALEERNERLSQEVSIEEIVTRWVSYCTRVAHENAVRWVERQLEEPLEQAEAELREERVKEHFPLAPLLPSAAEIMRAFPLDFGERKLADFEPAGLSPAQLLSSSAGSGT